MAEEKKKPSRTAPIAMEPQIPLTQEETEEKKAMEPKIASTSKSKEQGTLHINISFTEAFEQMPTYAKFLKNMVTKKRSTGMFATVALTQSSKSIIPPKMRDPGSFTIPYSIGGSYIGQALCDLGASIKLIALSIFKQLNARQLAPTTVTL
ncbi:uncharacterized protein LOC120077619 [Benincasa hispida]|uniref:uncharacterized protein LOC120077619 n=1 Tax=Benincasa hispida TaxID=102211 RepID=UPI001900119E|nr:uncharacterized protein LOC120077619 [Benincasa hispida]